MTDHYPSFSGLAVQQRGTALPSGWTETTISNPDSTQTRVYRKGVGSRILTLDAASIDRSGLERLPTEWLIFNTLRDQLERKVP